MTIMFGTGKIISIPTKANPTPVQLGEVIDCAIDINSQNKTLIGSKQYPIAVARGPGSITMKAKLATINGALLRELYLGIDKVTGRQRIAEETATIPASPGPYTVTVVNSANFVEDMGVVSPVTGQVFRRVASAPATGQYSVAAGVYTFAAADEADAVIINYRWTDASNGQTIAADNKIMGFQPVFSLSLSGYDQTDTTKTYELKFERVVASKFSFPFSNEDFAKPDFEMAAFANPATQRVFTLFTDDNA